MKINNPTAYNLAKVPWHVWGFVTWENDFRVANGFFAEQLRRKDLFWLMASTASRLKIRSRDFVYYFKPEWGGAEREHFHFLIARHGLNDKSPELISATMKELWGRRGIAKIEPFDQNKHLAGVLYTAKTERDSFGQPRFHNDFFSPGLKSLLRKTNAPVSENNEASLAA